MSAWRLHTLHPDQDTRSRSRAGRGEIAAPRDSLRSETVAIGTIRGAVTRVPGVVDRVALQRPHADQDGPQQVASPRATENARFRSAGGRWAWALLAPVDVGSVFDGDDLDGSLVVIDGVDDAVVAAS